MPTVSSSATTQPASVEDLSEALDVVLGTDRMDVLKRAEAILARQSGRTFAKRRLRIPDLSVVPLKKPAAFRATPRATAAMGAGAANSATAAMPSRLPALSAVSTETANDNGGSGMRRGFALPRLGFWSLLALVFIVGVASAYLSSRGGPTQHVITTPDTIRFDSAIV